MKVLFGRPLRIQVCPKKGVYPYISVLRMGLEPEKSYSREGFGFFGRVFIGRTRKRWILARFFRLFWTVDHHSTTMFWFV